MLTSSVVDHGFIGGVMVGMLASSVVDCGFKPWSSKTKDYEIGISFFSAKIKTNKMSSFYWLKNSHVITGNTSVASPLKHQSI
jgi:hypothetical protein